VRRLIAIVVALLVCAATQPVFAAPGGSYQGSCYNIHQRGSTLTATCSAANGARITSSTSAFCRGDIANSNGYLVCNGYGGGGGGHHHGGGRLPYGSYQQSCSNARMNGSMLFAVCPRGNGQRIGSSINVNRCPRNADIANRNGYLNCER